MAHTLTDSDAQDETVAAMLKLRALLLLLHICSKIIVGHVDAARSNHASRYALVAPAPEASHHSHGAAEHSATGALKAEGSPAASPPSTACIGACASPRDSGSGTPQAAVASGLATYLGGSGSRPAVVQQAPASELRGPSQWVGFVQSRARPGPSLPLSAGDSGQMLDDPVARAGLARMKILLQMRAQPPMGLQKSFQAQRFAEEPPQGQPLPNYSQLLQAIQSLNALQGTNGLPGPILPEIGSVLLNSSAQSNELQNARLLVDQVSRQNAPMVPRPQLEGPAIILKIALTASNLVDFLNGTEPTVSLQQSLPFPHVLDIAVRSWQRDPCHFNMMSRGVSAVMSLLSAFKPGLS